MILQKIADELSWHQKNVLELEKITQRYKGLSLEDAYEIQRLNIEKDCQIGDRLIGWKMGLTSIAKQESVGVDQPIYGRLLESMVIEEPILHVEKLIHPRVEPEIAFLFNKRLEGKDITEQDVWEATEFIMPALEVIDSRYKDFSFNLIDVVADNASSAKIFVSKKNYPPNQYNLDQIEVVMKLNGQIVQKGNGSAVMGNPVRSVMKLVQMLHNTGHCIEPGMVVLTGGITEAIHVQIGDVITVEYDKLGTLNMTVSH
ncbi:fumarylacetoacetate hydrolase family protein [Bacillus sp. RG28]|uniref:Fumarylacetoacetate hydrolase family protein n=1 Tax=Gottfriedia endophytica TaxID=2820819 RepID=A0A940SIE5_9BACI|nr:fumarylacetoacetate hydrolase family protein [Gottfriedia endophytica]MBP0727217.1 fumarylacetoacetate hydrolase family protein [Gottfriedia endophytica]